MNRLMLLAALGAMTALGGCMENDLAGTAPVKAQPVVVVPPPKPAVPVAGKAAVVVDASAFGARPGAGAVVVPAQPAPGGVVVVAP